jgi:pyruvate/2-oxoglutarate dehydrogenase complex dihydrolipoamide dehydrogenase (E3) component
MDSSFGRLPRRLLFLVLAIAVELAGVLQALGADTKLVVRKDGTPLLTGCRNTLDEEMQRQGNRDLPQHGWY